MEASDNIQKAIQRATAKILERNGGDISILFGQRFLYDNGNVILSFTDKGGSVVTAKYDYYGKTMETSFSLESL